MVGKKSDLGPIGENVSRAVRRFREERRLSYAELSRQLSEMGREIPPLGLRRIESGDRKVDVDDLVAIAVALNMSPLALLLPTVAGPVVPQGTSYEAENVWNWARGGFPLTTGVHTALTTLVEYMQASNPFTDYSDLIEAMKSATTIEELREQRARSEAQHGDD